jgi:tetratricopeptide (TPR) repeat protein
MKAKYLAVSLLTALFGVATPAVADFDADRLACGNSVSNDSIAACTRFIARTDLTSRDRFLAHFNRAWAYRRAGTNEHALADFDAAEALDRGSAKLYLSRAQTKYDLGQAAGALPDLERYVSLSPKDWAGYYQRARILRELHQNERALADVSRAIEVNPFGDELHPLRVLTLADLGRLDTAKIEADRGLVGRTSDATSHYARAVVSFGLRDFDAASVDVDAAIASEPLFAAAYALKAQIAEAHDDPTAAQKNYQLALRPGGQTLDKALAKKLAERRLAILTKPASSDQPCRRYLPMMATTIAVKCGA